MVEAVAALPVRIASKIGFDAAGCWMWTAYRKPNGYGQVHFDGKLRHAHRVVYEFLVGPIPDGLELDHLCRNRPCVNPAHLEPVAHSENDRRGLSGYALRTLCRSGRHDITDPANVYTNPGTARHTCRPCMNETQTHRNAVRRARTLPAREAVVR